MEPHERDLPSIAAKAPDAKLCDCSSHLSFALANSLAVAKRLTWEQTPWVAPRLHLQECERIADYMSVQLGIEFTCPHLLVTWMIGEAYQEIETVKGTRHGANPQIFIVFPHLKKDVTMDEAFWRVWHDEIITPAFNTAWEESGLVELEGAPKDFIGRIKTTPGGIRHSKEASPSAGFIEHLRKQRRHRVNTAWPSWDDPWSGGLEGQHSSKRAKIYDEAWKSICGMIENHPQMDGVQNPILLVVNRADVHFNMDWSLEMVYQAVGRQWDKCIDARYVKPGSFKVVVETVVGDVNQVQEEIDREARKKGKEPMRVVDFKRTVEAVEDVSEAAAKRQRMTE